MVECMHASVLGEHDLFKLTQDCVMKWEVRAILTYESKLYSTDSWSEGSQKEESVRACHPEVSSTLESKNYQNLHIPSA